MKHPKFKKIKTIVRKKLYHLFTLSPLVPSFSSLIPPFLFSHLGHLLIFLAFVNPLLFFIPLLFLFSSHSPASSWFPKGDVFLLGMAVNKWKYSIVILLFEQIAVITRVPCHHLRDLDCHDS